MCNIKMQINNNRRQYHCCSKRNKTRSNYRKSNPKFTISSVNNNQNVFIIDKYKKSNKNNNSTFNINISKINSNSNGLGYNNNSVVNLCYCYCKKIYWDFKNSFKNTYQIIDYLRHFCFYFQKHFSSFRLLIVIFLLAIITTTAHSIDTQGKLQRKSTSPIPFLSRPDSAQPPPLSLPPLTAASFSIASGTFINLTNFIHSPCYHNSIIPNALNIRLIRVCHNQSNLLKHFNNRSKFKKLQRSFQNEIVFVKKIIKNISIYYQSSKFHHCNSSSHHDHDNKSDGKNNSNTLKDLPKANYNINSKVIKFENIFNNNNINRDINRTVEREKYKVGNEENVQKINNLNINKFIRHFRLNDNKHKENNKTKHNTDKENFILNNDDTLLANGLKNMQNYQPEKELNDEEEEEDTYNKTNEHINIDDHHNHDEFDYIDDEKYDVELLDLFSPVTAASSIKKNSTTKLDPPTTINKPTNLISITHIDPQTQYIDNQKLLKLVMNGLGFEKPPDMKHVNISQKEYSAKYREYLRRVHDKKQRSFKEEFDGYDGNILRPLQFFSIISNSSLLSRQEYRFHRETGFLRQKRYALESYENQEGKDGEIFAIGDVRNKSDERKQTLEERVKQILFLKKKYKKPRSTKQKRTERKTNIRLMFALKPDILTSSDIEEANTRLVLIYSPILAIRNHVNKKFNPNKPKKLCGLNANEGQKNKRQINVLNLKLYFMPKIGKRILLDGQKVNIPFDITKPDDTHTQWLQFDVTKAVRITLEEKKLQHVAFELQCDNCKRVGARILNDAYNTAIDAQADDTSTEGYQLMPVLNIIGRLGQSQRFLRPHKYENYRHNGISNEESSIQRHYHHQTNSKNRQNRRTNCYKSNQRCCRHSMQVTFKEIKGFEFIIQPKVFDAGYCHGRCPPRYNPAHHHAMLQSLIWKQNHNKAPRLCCVPSKLVELEVLHVDEKDSEKLKISTWSDMKVVECACS